MRILSWNVNGLRAIHKKGFLEWLEQEKPDILCIQETKLQESQIPDDIRNIKDLHIYFNSAERKGYSGVALFSKLKPRTISNGFGIKKYDTEGRTIVADFGKFVILNIYFPNGKQSNARLNYKMAFYDVFLDYTDKLRKKDKILIVCGDVNTAHKEIDLARPKENKKASGFLPQERAWIDKFLSHGYIDTFRMFNMQGGNYSWWDYKSRARLRNIGWRIDYFFVSDNARNCVKDAFIMTNVPGSDHCPVGIDFKFKC